MWAQIRAGHEPTSERVDHVAEIDSAVLGATSVQRLRSRLSADVFGAGPLEPLIADPEVTDVLVNGVAGVWVDRGQGLEPVGTVLGDSAAVRRLAVRLATLAGRRLDETCPYVDGLLPGGVRLHAVLPPLVEGAAHISLRVPRATILRLDDLVRAGSVDARGRQVLRRLVASRVAFVVTGGTGSGKTTLLAALLSEIDPTERIVIAEDVRELNVDHPHVVRLEGRSPNVEGTGAVSLTTLVRQSLRMRPDRLVVGEVRGAEVRELLSALNTGHEGGCGTVHANTCGDVVARFEALGALAGMPQPAVHAQLASALQVVVHVRREGGRRYVAQIGVLGWVDTALVVSPALTWRAGALRPDLGWARLSKLVGLPEAA
ncbi:TadA family conjugal transfer-associated ATPase [Leekyejoonella antrihumi]|uniref:TadA family conjugal transfer-associated ATPase n=2 Tax=Leekyejoonella antrihumi TaxID=1660198 RepID=A0A563DVY3_9MICO|nr:TadA family conjugal transfer-associated ATPase [Leekyejoonella antrihumi]